MRISEDKINKIKEEALAILFRNSPKAMFTVEIASHMARDEEFMKKLLLDLETKGLVSSVRKNINGTDYIRRIRWRLTNTAFQAYQRVHSENLSYDEEEHTYS